MNLRAGSTWGNHAKLDKYDRGNYDQEIKSTNGLGRHSPILGYYNDKKSQFDEIHQQSFAKEARKLENIPKKS